MRIAKNIRRTEEGSSREQTHGDTSLLGGEHIGDDTTSISERRGAERTGKETKDDQGPDILGASATRVEGSQGEVGTEEDDLTAEHFTKRGPQQRT